MADEGDVPGTGLLDTGNPYNLDVAVSLETATQSFGEVAQLHGEGSSVRDAAAVPERASFSSSSAIRCSCCSTRLLSDGRRRKIADALRHSRCSIAGWPVTNPPASTDASTALLA